MEELECVCCGEETTGGVSVIVFGGIEALWKSAQSSSSSDMVSERQDLLRNYKDIQNILFVNVVRQKDLN